MNDLTQHEINIIRMQMNLAKNLIMDEYKKSNKDDRFSRKVINDYEIICNKLDHLKNERECQREVCELCEGDGYMTKDYETGDCPTCEGTGYITLTD